VNGLPLSNCVSVGLYLALNAKCLLTQRVDLGAKLFIHLGECFLLNLELSLLDHAVVLIDEQVQLFDEEYELADRPVNQYELLCVPLLEVLAHVFMDVENLLVFVVCLPIVELHFDVSGILLCLLVIALKVLLAHLVTIYHRRQVLDNQRSGRHEPTRNTFRVLIIAKEQPIANVLLSLNHRLALPQSNLQLHYHLLL
jgi:hypothetical protein